MREHSICTLKFKICNKKKCMEKENENLNNLLSTYEEANRNLNNHAELLTGKFRNKGKKVWDCIKKKGQTKKISILKERVQKALWFTNLDFQSENGSINKPLVKVKLGADGAKISRVSNFLVLSITLLDNDQIMAEANIHW